MTPPVDSSGHPDTTPRFETASQAGLSLLLTPVWLLGSRPARLLWANPAAVAETGLGDWARLREHAVSDEVSASLREQLPALFAALGRGDISPQHWLLPLPGGQLQQLCRLRQVLLDGDESGLLIEALAESIPLEPGGDVSPYGFFHTLEALQKSETLLAEAEHIAHLGSWQLDATTRELSYSREAFRIFGLDPDRPAPTFEEHQALIHPEDRDLWMRTISESIRQVKSFEIQFRSVLSDGSFRILESRGQCHLNAQQQVTELRGTVQDITERKRMERIKDEFVSTVSHELRTPLTSIRGSLGLVTGSMAADLPAKAAGLLRIAYKNCERLVNLVNDILDMAKIESGSMEYRFRALDMIGLIEQAIEANRPFAQQFDVSLDFSEHFPEAVVFGDSDRLMQVMANLLANAVKYSPAGDQVSIKLQRYQGMLRISVSDRGPGIPEEYRDKVFEKFGQVDASDVRRKGGTGLGLAIVQAIVKKHWGFINFDSALGQGTVFHVDLPEYHQRKSTQRAQSAPLMASGSRAASATDERDHLHRLMVVEDDHNTADLLQEMLEREGYIIDVASSAREALQLINSHRYVAITVDLLLPDQDGISLIRSIRAHPQGQSLPIIVVSLSAEQGREIMNGEALGIIDWLSKPVDNRRLLKAINQAMRHLDQGQARILHVEDDVDVLRVVAAVLGRAATVETATSLHEAGEKLNAGAFDLVIIDIGLPDGSGLALLDLIKDCRPRPPVLVFSAQDCDSHVAQEISAVLVKSRTTNRQLCNTIKTLIRR